MPANLCKPALSRRFIEVYLRRKPQFVWKPNFSQAACDEISTLKPQTTLFRLLDATSLIIFFQNHFHQHHWFCSMKQTHNTRKKGRHWMSMPIKLTSFKDDAVVGDFVSGLEAGAVPAVPPELVLAFMDGNLDSLDCWGCHIRITHAYIQLAPCQARKCQTNCVGVQDRFHVWELQAQDFVGVHPAWNTPVRLWAG